jgi:predicted MFS family arabinose efflux permease
MDAAQDTPWVPRPERRDPPSLFPAALAASFAGISVTYLLPFLVGSLMDGIGLDARRAGVLTSVEMGAMASGALLVAPRIGRLSRKALALGTGAALLVLNGCSAAQDSFVQLLFLRALAGLAEGCLFAVSTAAVAASVAPTRGYAWVEAAGTLLWTGLFLIVPQAVALWQQRGAFGTLFVITLCCAPLFYCLPAHPPREVEAGDAGWTLWTPSTLAIVCTGALLYLSESSLWAFTERIGGSVGLSGGAVGGVLGMTNLIFVLAALCVSRLHLRWGRALPLGVGIAGFGASLLLIASARSPLQYVAGHTALAIAFAFQWIYLQGLAAAMDPAGRVAAALAGATLVGGALGPAVGGQLAWWGGYPALGALALAAAALALALVLPVAQQLDRAEAATAGAQRSSR